MFFIAARLRRHTRTMPRISPLTSVTPAPHCNARVCALFDGARLSEFSEREVIVSGFRGLPGRSHAWNAKANEVHG